MIVRSGVMGRIPDRDRDDLIVGVQVEEPSVSVSVRATRRSVPDQVRAPHANGRGPIVIENATHTFGRTLPRASIGGRGLSALASTQTPE